MLKYGQFCPVAKAAELIGERWTLLIVRELLFGSTRYADLQRGLGRISPSVLSQRLKSLCDAGIIVKTKGKDGPEYLLTDSGRELMPLVEVAGTWGQRWARSKMTKDELDLDLLMLEVQRGMDPTPLPEHAVVCIIFTDQPARRRRWWLLIDHGEVDVCTDFPGREPLVTLETTLRTLTQIWMGDLGIQRAIDEQLLRYQGPQKYCARAKQWLGLSRLAGVTPAARAAS
jgi:DNA-binding HxlR family transcriptional regulator